MDDRIGCQTAVAGSDSAVWLDAFDEGDLPQQGWRSWLYSLSPARGMMAAIMAWASASSFMIWYNRRFDGDQDFISLVNTITRLAGGVACKPCWVLFTKATLLT